jgi:hypothetical protein
MLIGSRFSSSQYNTKDIFQTVNKPLNKTSTLSTNHQSKKTFRKTNRRTPSSSFPIWLYLTPKTNLLEPPSPTTNLPSALPSSVDTREAINLTRHHSQNLSQSNRSSSSSIFLVKPSDSHLLVRAEGPEQTSSSLSPSSIWVPQIIPPFNRCSHPFDTSCSDNDLETLVNLSSLPGPATFTRLSTNPTEKVTISELRFLLSHNSEINQQIMNLYLQLLCRQFGIKMLDSGFQTTLHRQGWNGVRTWFRSCSSRRQQRTCTPALQGENAITIPCHFNGCH